MTTTTLDLTGLAAAIEARDADAVTAHYAHDAVITVVDRDHQPSAPQVLSGIAEIGAYYEDVCARNMEHQVTDLTSDSERLAFVQRCRYPSGERVLCVTVATLADGLISRQTCAQVWDA